MKKSYVIVISIILMLSIVGCTNDSEIKTSTLNGEIDTLSQELNELQVRFDNLQLEYNEYKEKMAPYEDLSEQELILREEAAKKELEEINKQKEAERLEKERIAEEEMEKKEIEEKLGYDTGITYDQIARNPDEYIDKKVKFRGEVIQVMENDDIVNLRLAVDGNYDNILYLYYRNSLVSSRVLEGDNITIYGISKGLMSYTSIMGGNITIPEIMVRKIDL